jgi:nucleoside-diphosphate kinase
MKDLKKYLESNVNDPMRKNHVLVVVKPGFEHLLTELVQLFIDNHYKIVKTVTKRLQLDEAKRLYIIHKKEKFYTDLCEYMSSGISTAFILRKKSDNIFDDFAKIKDEVRKKYSQSEMRNVLHSSDSYKNFTHEAGVYFYNVNQTDLL